MGRGQGSPSASSASLPATPRGGVTHVPWPQGGPGPSFAPRTPVPGASWALPQNPDRWQGPGPQTAGLVTPRIPDSCNRLPLLTEGHVVSVSGESWELQSQSPRCSGFQASQMPHQEASITRLLKVFSSAVILTDGSEIFLSFSFSLPSSHSLMSFSCLNVFKASSHPSVSSSYLIL